MNWLRPPSPRTALALLAGVLWALAFPLFGIQLLAWLAPGLLLLTGLGVNPRAALRLGWLAGLAHHLIALYWLLHIPFAFGNVAGWLALSAYCALFPALWLWLCVHLRPGLPPGDTQKTGEPSTRFLPRTDPYAVGAAPVKLRGETWDALRALIDAGWYRRQAWLLFAAAAWVGLEFLRGWFLSGFPWNFLGASQFKLIPLIQLASVTGVQGVSFLVVWVSVSLAAGAAVVLLRPQQRFAWKNEVAAALITLLLVVSWGLGRATQPPAPADGDRTTKLALVQPSIPQTLIFDPEAATNRFNQLLALTREALALRPDVVIWPEASLPVISEDSFAELLTLIQDAGIPLILGADDAERTNFGPRERVNYYNAAFHFGGDGRFKNRYRKQRLVIFGEYTPGARWLPFLAKWFPAGMGFAAGLEPVSFRVEPIGANVTVNICFEDNFADLVRAQVQPDTDFVLNLTNNGWFGESAAQWQHAANAIFRAIENNVPLVRGTNNGLTCWIDEHGRLRQVFTDAAGSVYGSGVAVFEVPLLRPGTPRKPTLYSRFGDWPGWTCLALVALGYARIAVQHRRRPVGG
jgi:apolipoprotein N-acyltransferase